VDGRPKRREKYAFSNENVSMDMDYGAVYYTTLFSNKNVKLFMRFGHFNNGIVVA